MMSQAERVDRRKEMAEAFSAGECRYDIARRYKVSTKTVRDSCREFSVDYPDFRSELTSTEYDVLFALIQGSSIRSLVAKCGISRGRVKRIKRSAEKAGFVFNG